MSKIKQQSQINCRFVIHPSRPRASLVGFGRAWDSSPTRHTPSPPTASSSLVGVPRISDGENRKIVKQALLEFLVHGLRYVFYTQPGPLSRGLPTAHSVGPLKSKLVTSPLEVYVWPDPKGMVRGQAIAPLYRCVPEAAKNDPELYALLSLIDALGVGRVREQRLAASELEKRICTP